MRGIAVKGRIWLVNPETRELVSASDITGQKASGIPIQPDHLVVFGEEVVGLDYHFEDGCQLSRHDGKKVDVFYQVVALGNVDLLHAEQVAAHLMRFYAPTNTPISGALDILQEALKQYTNFKLLHLYSELRSQDSSKLSKRELELLEQIPKREELKPYIRQDEV